MGSGGCSNGIGRSNCGPEYRLHVMEGETSVKVQADTVIIVLANAIFYTLLFTKKSW